MEESFISTQDACCRNDFARLISVAQPEDGASITELFDRFKIWSANFGANQTGEEYPKSLDYRLRNAPVYKEQILAILQQLIEYIQEAECLVQGVGRPQAIEYSDDEELNSDSLDSDDDEPLGRWTLSDSEDEAPDDRSFRATRRTTIGLESLSNNTSSPLTVTISSIGFAVNSLYRIPIRDPASYRRLQRYASAVEDDYFDMYKHFDKMFVLDVLRFLRVRGDATPVSSKISTRLARLVTERRKILRFRKMHNEELRQKKSESEESKAAVPESSGQSKDPTDAVQGDQLKGTNHGAVTLPKSSLKATTFRPKDADSPFMNQPEAQAAVEADEMSSVATTTFDKDIIHIPPRPMDAQSVEFEDFICPYCWTAVHIRSDQSWKRHVLQDLKPYVCTYSNCEEPDRLYKHRDDWWAHVSQHYLSLACGEGNHGSYAAEEDFIAHMTSAHGQKPESFNVPSVLDAFRRTSHSPSGSCQFCGNTTSNLKQHVGRHLQRIALFALPRYAIAADHSELASGSHSSNRYAAASGRNLDSAIGSSVSSNEAPPSGQSSQAGVEPPPTVPELADSSWEAIESMLERNAPRKSPGVAASEPEGMLSDLFSTRQEQGDSAEENMLTRDGEMRSASILPFLVTFPRLTVGQNNIISLQRAAFRRGVHGAVIRGESGSGKTHLARQFRWKYEHRYRQTFWVDCSTIDTMDAWVNQLRNGLSVEREALRNAYEDVFTYLAQTDAWLLILDGLTSDTMMYLTRLDVQVAVTSQSLLLCTATRFKRFQALQGLRMPVMDMTPLTEVEALELLQKHDYTPETDFRTAGSLYPAAVLAMIPEARLRERDSEPLRDREQERRIREWAEQGRQDTPQSRDTSALDEILEWEETASDTTASAPHDNLPAEPRVASVSSPPRAGSTDEHGAEGQSILPPSSHQWSHCIGQRLGDVEHGGHKYHCWMPTGPLEAEWEELKPAYMVSLEKLPNILDLSIEVDMLILSRTLNIDEAKIYILVQCPNRKRASLARRYLHDSDLSLDRGFHFISATKWPYNLHENEEILPTVLQTAVSDAD